MPNTKWMVVKTDGGQIEVEAPTMREALVAALKLCDDEEIVSISLSSTSSCVVASCSGMGSCTNPTTEPHTCPFQVEINEDRESLCNCCDRHEQECADAI